MASIKEYNVKIKSLKNTQKMTKTMKMVSASKLRKAHEAQLNAKLYAHNISALVSRLSLSVDTSHHPLLLESTEPKSALILVFTSDRGLCGAFNHNAHKHVNSWLTDNQKSYNSIELSFCGRRGFNFFKNMANVKTYYENVTGAPRFIDAQKIGEEISQNFLEGVYDEVYLAYNQFFSPLLQKTIFEKILPIDPAAIIEIENQLSLDYIFEPDASELLEFLIPHFLYFKIYFALLENSAGEHGARMSAMDNATKNATEMIGKYTLLRNRARQSQITTELTEIVAGAEALN